MFQGDRRILKGRVTISLRQMPSIARFRKETQVRQRQSLQECTLLIKHSRSFLLSIAGMKKHHAHHDEHERQKREKQI